MRRTLLHVVCGLAAALPLVLVAGCESSSTNDSPGIDASAPTFDAGSGDGGANPSGDGDAGATNDSGPTGDPNALCTQHGSPVLGHQGTPHRQINNPDPVESAPAPLGGTIVNGIYDEVSNTNWGNGTGMSGSNDLSLLVLESGAWFYRYSFDGNDDGLFSAGTYTVDPAKNEIVFSNAACGGGGVPSTGNEALGFTATADTFMLYRDQLVGQTRLVKERLFKKRP